MSNINSVLRKAKSILVADCDHWNKDISHCNSLADVREALNVASTTRFVKILECGNRIGYRMVNSTYTFELTIN